MNFKLQNYILLSLHFSGSGSDDYELLSGKHCGGHTINSWNDGSYTNYGTLVGLPECKKLCSDHSECAGFVHRTTDDICGFWKLGHLKPFLKENRNCYKKREGNNVL